MTFGRRHSRTFAVGDRSYMRSWFVIRESRLAAAPTAANNGITVLVGAVADREKFYLAANVYDSGNPAITYFASVPRLSLIAPGDDIMLPKVPIVRSGKDNAMRNLPARL